MLLKIYYRMSFLSFGKIKINFKMKNLTVSYNQSVSYIRQTIKEKKYHTQLSPLISQEQLEFETDHIQIEELKENILHNAINLLPARKRQVFELCKLQGKTYNEAAFILDIAPDTVKEYMIASLKFVKNHVRSNYSIGGTASLSIFWFFFNS
jgi:RNA polymerase sigma factor (sigma-70 family)